jgi:maltose alpha-D-glucosyltransferase / alpha-amylase
MKDAAEMGRWGVFLRNSEPLDLRSLSRGEHAHLLEAYGRSERMRTESGLGLRRRLSPLLDGDRTKLEMCTVLLLSLPGAPFLYYGDEIGVGDNLALAGTDGLRTPMAWSPDRGGGFSNSEPDMWVRPLVQDSLYGYQVNNVEFQTRSANSLLLTIRRRLEVRRSSAALNLGTLELIESTNPAVLAYLRICGASIVLCVINFSGFPEATELKLAEHVHRTPIEMLGGGVFPSIGSSLYPLSLNGHGTYWLKLAGDGETGAA